MRLVVGKGLANLSDNWGGGGVYSYIRVMPDGFLLKSIQIQRNLLPEIKKFLQQSQRLASHLKQLKPSPSILSL